MFNGYVMETNQFMLFSHISYILFYTFSVKTHKYFVTLKPPNHPFLEKSFRFENALGKSVNFFTSEQYTLLSKG